ncbi:MAG: hypothetical protein ACLRLE_03865 [Turicibacter sp.]|uniref:hypothetical protein n=1 Tax=Turicibacter sp. GALT-G1 TaxID=2951140 RepID=UPI0021D4DC27|nr:hypothetical protein [Turicibacter sp. GALT-G1]MCU7206559.1 hypothetical protein [Turicibacter sp. GALT-G1]
MSNNPKEAVVDISKLMKKDIGSIAGVEKAEVSNFGNMKVRLDEGARMIHQANFSAEKHDNEEQ